MKKLVLLLFFIPFIAVGQEYSEVIEITGQTADQLYSKANEWFALTFKSANDVIQLNDPVEKKIIGKGIKRVDYAVGKWATYYNASFTLFVQFKDGRYKYDISTTELKTPAGQTYSYDLLKQCTTVEGQTEYLKSIGASPWVIGKKQIQMTADGNVMAVAEIEKQLKAIIDDLTIALKKGDDKSSW